MDSENPPIVDISLPLDRAEDENAWRRAVARHLEISPKQVVEMRLRKRSIDARKKRIRIQLRIEVGIDKALPPEPAPSQNLSPVASSARRVLIVGAGPAGLFAALRCLELGAKPILIERGKDASARRFDLKSVLSEGRVIEDSNYCFGEGGAGTFSDGKLYTRAKKRGPVAEIYRTLVAHGAPTDILTDSHPHIGSNLLPKVIMALRKSITDAGGEVRFETCVSDLLISDGRVRGVVTRTGEEIEAASLILATGHSARDIYRLFAQRGLLMEAKPFAMGMRIEHPQALIDSQQYHLGESQPRPDLLPAASYSLATKIRGRGVHSFCMCPGGFIVPAATENDEVVVNGMSLAKRDSPFANSGLVVTVEPEDTRRFEAEHGVLAGMAFQRELETNAKLAGGGGQVAPAQRLTDFLNGRDSQDLPATSYHPGLKPARLDEILPYAMVGLLKRGFSQFGKRMHGYLTREANLVGFETRTSSPVRIPRDPESLQHPEVAGLYPCGEGAGYAGGIVSAALDGLKCAEAAASSGVAGA